MEKLCNVAEIVLKYKRTFAVQEKCNRSSLANTIVRELAKKRDHELGLVENFYVVLLDISNGVIGAYHTGKGGLDSVQVDKRVICSVALIAGATKVILAHNHPSGKLVPSSSDRNITMEIQEGLTTVGVVLEDHIILSGINNSYLSFRDEGLM